MDTQAVSDSVNCWGVREVMSPQPLLRRLQRHDITLMQLTCIHGFPSSYFHIIYVGECISVGPSG